MQEVTSVHLKGLLRVTQEEPKLEELHVCCYEQPEEYGNKQTKICYHEIFVLVLDRENNMKIKEYRGRKERKRALAMQF